MSVYNTTLSDCDYVFPFNSVSDDDNAFSNNASANCFINIDETLRMSLSFFCLKHSITTLPRNITTTADAFLKL